MTYTIWRLSQLAYQISSLSVIFGIREIKFQVREDKLFGMLPFANVWWFGNNKYSIGFLYKGFTLQENSFHKDSTF